ncbi:tryptophan halogenase-domain-containing protein [Aspergillus flavus]|uniref:Tryptophan halogenase-domain-containing protein n=1 Tax=Aspergillus flavus (strain ATCC 200026 / FGSC A1120 / IAM 13836 / NRRL 3357 / JCM 12722 / SRRC 167) TaxID=332952 RepID=A0A7U2R1H7_ASPFN|nr:tryptophan halogenase-domain-containing protein [Aspergillus flavus]
MRHLLRFIDYTDFIAAGGPNHFSWNVIRSEADELLFRHAAHSGAKTFEAVKVNSVTFTPSPTLDTGPGRPVSASYTQKSDGATGVVGFKYIIDASGRAGLLNTKYLKNRKYNQGPKNVAVWAYWKATGKYGEGTPRENSPYFEALTDESGWAWFIPLHDGTHSVGVVMDQGMMSQKKAVSELSANARYLSWLKLAPRLNGYLTGGKMVTDLKTASDFSYDSSSYAFPYARVAGDAGCFIDPFFSSGVHLAITGGLSAATTICAAIRGDCDEVAAARWHSTKVKEGYSHWLVIVLSAYKQMSNQAEPVLSDVGEDNFDRAFNFFKPSKSPRDPILQVQGKIHVQSHLPPPTHKDDCLPTRHDSLRMLRVSGNSSLISYIQGQHPGVKVHNNSFIGAASYNIFVGISVATIFGAAFFFDLFWPDRYESPSVRLAWKICAVVVSVMMLSSALLMTCPYHWYGRRLCEKVLVGGREETCSSVPNESQGCCLGCFSLARVGRDCCQYGAKSNYGRNLENGENIPETEAKPMTM